MGKTFGNVTAGLGLRVFESDFVFIEVTPSIYRVIKYRDERFKNNEYVNTDEVIGYLNMESTKVLLLDRNNNVLTQNFK